MATVLQAVACEGLDVTGHWPGQADLLTPSALAFLGELHRQFEPGRQARLTARRVGAYPGQLARWERPVAEPGPLFFDHMRANYFHFAILLPDRPSLGRFVRHLGAIGAQAGAADHLVSEAFYLQDPDNLGIEVYADRPRDQWRRVGRELMMATDPIDVQCSVEGSLGPIGRCGFHLD